MTVIRVLHEELEQHEESEQQEDINAEAQRIIDSLEELAYGDFDENRDSDSTVFDGDSLSDADSMGDFSNEGEDWVIQMNESSWTTLSDRRIDLAIQSMCYTG